MRDLLNIAGQSFVISGFVFSVLAIPLYFIYPPLYTGLEEHATNLLFFSKLGFFWTFVGLCPIILSMVVKEIHIGDLVFYDKGGLSPEGPGIVLDKVSDVSIGWLDDDNAVTSTRYQIYWQGGAPPSWHWENSVLHYEETSRSDEQEAPY